MARQCRVFAAGAKEGVSVCRLCVCVAVLLGPLFQMDADAQPANWRVTILQITSADWQHPDCVNTSVTVNIPGPTGAADADICGVQATFTVGAQSVTLAFEGALDIGGCVWNITSPVRGIGFISGGSVPATGMTGTAETNCFGGNFRNEVGGSFQAQRVVGGGGLGITTFTGRVQVTPPGQAPILLTPLNAAGLTISAGTRIEVQGGSSATIAFPDGDVVLSENTNFVVAAQRFFLLVPWRVPLRQSFERIRWRCIPTPGGCASVATPNARLAFLPPIAAPPGIAVLADEEDLTLSVTYS